ncbi:putative pentatricopeptide repeat-containing protein At5g09950 [Selaginella moellendorffii]|uniref:putative pentatricopeptide repeat-containing protein At5g09950 n=1 Tax=Selaginella moellendorffii TaxID=88036 RepID=UPI000D1CF988|nr:putative pentatricopeptide repeat-containing protein At5g09950 [Selaginella moellendorffii]|eukprot:XP_024517953.1 putative pentatricopeptide repeat-containing protein At5g09950 [Selaginella moellendorffii]
MIARASNALPVQARDGRGDRAEILAALKECAKRKDLARGKRIHAAAVECGLDSDLFVGSSLVSMYSRCGSVARSRMVFDAMEFLDRVSWNSLVLGYAENGWGEIALKLFLAMQDEGHCSPDSSTFVAAIKACSSLSERESGVEVEGMDRRIKVESLEKGMRIHRQAWSSGFERDIFVANALIHAYAKCGSLVDATKVFHAMPRRDEVSWNALMVGAADNGEPELALQLLVSMKSEGRVAPNPRTFLAAIKACGCCAVKEHAKEIDSRLVKLASLEKGMALHSLACENKCDSSVFVASALVDMYAKCGSIADAQRVFDSMQDRNVISWTSMIFGCVDNSQDELALELFRRMVEEKRCPLDAWTFVAALKACGNLAALETGREIHEQIRDAGLEREASIAATLVDFYGRCGSMDEALEAFQLSSQEDMVAWTALVAGYSRQGDTPRVLELFQALLDKGLRPDVMIFSSLLSACSHAGLVDLGKRYFEEMSSKFGLAPGIHHYHCVVDLLSRSNRLEEAVAMVARMPFEATLVTWTTVLAGCHKWKNSMVGRMAFQRLIALDRRLDSAYALMANIYGSLGLWKERQEIQAMRSMNVL